MDEEKIEAILPQGSGINHDWDLKVKNKRMYAYNAYDYIDEYGSYDDIFPLVVCFDNTGFKYLHFTGYTRNQYRKIEYAGLRDYLEYTFCDIEDKIKELL